MALITGTTPGSTLANRHAIRSRRAKVKTLAGLLCDEIKEGLSSGRMRGAHSAICGGPLSAGSPTSTSARRARRAPSGEATLGGDRRHRLLLSGLGPVHLEAAAGKTRTMPGDFMFTNGTDVT
jgi:hypothetical protein